MNNKTARFILAVFLALAMILPYSVANARPVTPIKKTPTTIIVAEPGEVVPEGTMVVYRFVDHDELTEVIQGGPLTEDITAGPDGMFSHDVWYGYKADAKAEKDAFKQVIADWKSANCTEGAWNYGYTIFFFEDEVTEEYHDALKCEE